MDAGTGDGMKKLIVALIVVACTSTCAPAARAHQGSLPVLTFVLAGQSNMEGEGRIDGRTPVNPRVTVLRSTRWVTATEPLPQGLANPPAPQLPGLGVGPGIAFADFLIYRGAASRVRLVSCSLNGSYMDSWVPGAIYYTACAAQIRTAVPIAGVLFYQGESDALYQQRADIWASQFRRFVVGMQHLTHNAPVMFAQLGPLPVQQPFQVAWNLVKAQQASIRMVGVKMVRTDDLAVMPPAGVHHTAAAERAVGLRFARAWSTAP